MVSKLNSLLDKRSTQWGLLILSLSLLVYTFIRPAKTIVKTKVEVQEKIKEVEVEKIVEVEKEAEVREVVRVVEREINKPDGTVIKEKVEEKVDEIITKVRQEERDRYNRLLKEKEFTKREVSKKETPRQPLKGRLFISGGYNPITRYGMGSVQYRILGPIHIGGMGDTEFNTAITIGVRF